MFELSAAIDNWRQTIGTKGECSLEDIQELESHLLEQFHELTSAGLSEREAFFVSVSRIGTPEEINNQYAKADPTNIWKHRALWMIAGILCWFSLIWFHRIVIAKVDFSALALFNQDAPGPGSTVIAENTVFLLLAGVGLRFALHLMTRPSKRNWITMLTATRSRLALSIVAVLFAGLLGEIVAQANLSYAASTLSNANQDLYFTYRFISEKIVFTLIAVAMGGVAILVSNRKSAFPMPRVRRY